MLSFQNYGVLVVCLCFPHLAGADFRVTLLGTGSPPPAMDRFGPSILVEAGSEKLLFDSGRGATQRLRQLGVPLKDISVVFLTHLHSDHTVGIPDLWLTGWVFGRQRAFDIRGPEGTRHMMKHLEEAYSFDIHIRGDVDEQLPPTGIAVGVREIKEGPVYEANGVKVIAFEVDHRPIVPAFGYRIEYNGKVAVFSGDTRKSENLVKFAEEADLLVHEVGGASEELLRTSPRTKKVVEHHTLPEEVADILNRVKPKLAVYSHFAIFGISAQDVVERTKARYRGPVESGVDLMSFTIGDTVEVEVLDGGAGSGETVIPGRTGD